MACYKGYFDGDPPQLLDPDMFLFWKKRFEVFVRVNYHSDFWLRIEFARADTTSTSGKQLNLEVTNLLYRAIPDKLFGIIYKCETAHDIWKTLNMTYGDDLRARDSKVANITREFETCKMLPGESIKSMLRRYDIIIRSLKKLGVTYTTEKYVAKVLSCLPSDWDDMVKTTIRERKDFCLLSLDDLFELLTHCETMLDGKRNLNTN